MQGRRFSQDFLLRGVRGTQPYEPIVEKVLVRRSWSDDYLPH